MRPLFMALATALSIAPAAAQSDFSKVEMKAEQLAPGVRVDRQADGIAE